VVPVDPVPVEKKAESGGQEESDDVGGDVVGQQRLVSQKVVRHPEAQKGNEESADRDDREFEQLEEEIPATVFPEGPIPVSKPRDEGGDGDRDDLGTDGALEEMPTACDAQPERIENADVDEIPQKADYTELEGVSDELLVEQRPEVGKHSEHGNPCESVARASTESSLAPDPGCSSKAGAR
jgi:hypothetical protein